MSEEGAAKGLSSLAIRIRKRKVGIPLNVMIVGREGVGKTSFISTLIRSLGLAGHLDTSVPLEPSDVSIGNISVQNPVEVSLQGGRVVLTLIDTPGLPYSEKDSNQLNEIMGYIEGQFEASLIEELKVRRNPKAVDTHVHVILYFIMPNKEGIHPHDVYAMSKLSHRANVIPCLGMADSITKSQLYPLKKSIMEILLGNAIPIMKFAPDPKLDGDLVLSDSEEEDLMEETIAVVDSLPFTVINAEPTDLVINEHTIVGREYPWGVIDCDKTDHCDLSAIKITFLASHLSIFKMFTRDVLYERYRTERLLAHKMLMEEKSPDAMDKEE